MSDSVYPSLVKFAKSNSSYNVGTIFSIFFLFADGSCPVIKWFIVYLGQTMFYFWNLSKPLWLNAEWCAGNKY